MKKTTVLFALLMTCLATIAVNGQAFITTWKTDNPGTSNDDQITIPTRLGATYNYTVDWGDGSSDTGVTGDITHTYSSAGTYTVQITGDFPRIFFQNTGDKDKLLTIEQWGNIAWSSMEDAFFGCTNLDVTATDAPDLSGVTSLYRMFGFASSFNGAIGHWEVGTITTMDALFAAADSFNQDISGWDVSNVVSFSLMFDNADVFNQDINNWDVSSATNMSFMFRSASAFDQPLNSWDVSNVTEMREMFRGAISFNQPLNSWDVSSVTTMQSMFFGASVFNQPIGGWDVSSVTNLDNMFRAAIAFDQDLNDWNVGNVTTASGLFNSATSFNGDISSWNVGSLTNMTSLFNDAEAFNQNISNWNVSSATTMSSMFNDASSFNQNLGQWDVSAVTNMTAIFGNSGLSTANYDNILKGWSALTLQPNVTLGANGINFCNESTAHNILTGAPNNWAITDAGQECLPFITTWKTDNSGTSNDDQITIPTTGTGYDYTINWGDGNSDTNVSGDITHTYASAGTYTVEISGDFPRIYFNNTGDKDKILTIEQWGDIDWTSMQSAFYGCSNLAIAAADAPDLSNSNVSGIANFNMGLAFKASGISADLNHWDVSNVFDMTQTFAEATNFNGDITSWDVSGATQTVEMFSGATLFNQPIGNWDVSNVQTMNSMFRESNFNQDISDWDVGQVSNFNLMFRDNAVFNQDISGWDVSAATIMSSMFSGATEFDQDISAWNVANVQNFSAMFFNASSFDQLLSGWNVGSATNMTLMFSGAADFNNNLGDWNVSGVTSMINMFNGSGLSKRNYDKILEGWSQLTLQDNVTFGAAGIEYCHGADARQSIIDTHNWSITDGGENCLDFITTWKTDNVGTSMDNQITIPTTGSGYNYTVDWGDGNSDTDVTGDITHTYAAPGTFTVSISGDFPRIFFNGGGDRQKILTIEQWGDIQWTSMEKAFLLCVNLTSNATDAPDLSQVTRLSNMFQSAISFTGDLSTWDVSNITDMSLMFNFARAFTSDLSAWDVSNVVGMSSMFNDARVFNSDLSAWDVSSVTSTNQMFRDARIFSSDLSNWNVSNVRDARDMFANAFAFNSDISSWDVSKVFNMDRMFSNATSFNQDISSWNVSAVTTMNGTFSGAANFNQDISGWNVSLVTNMNFLFNRARNFNQDISGWNVSAVTTMNGTFLEAELFDQDLSGWDIRNVTNLANAFDLSGLTKDNYDNILEGWSMLTLQDDVTLGADGIDYCNTTARQSIINDFNWTINDGEPTIVWDGTSWCNGVGPGAGSDDVIIDGDYNMGTDGYFDSRDLTVNSGATLTIDGESSLVIQQDLVNNGSIIVESGSDFTTYSPNTITGNDITFKRNTRYADGRYSFVGSPVVQDASITGADLGSFVFKYNETTPYGSDEGLARWEDAGGDELVPGIGYTQANQLEIVFVGMPNQGTITIDGTYTEDVSDDFEGWTLVSNPYPAPIDVADFLSGNPNTNGAIYIWDDNGSDTQRGTNADYIVANGTMATNTTPAGGQTRYDQIMGSMQGFFVKLNSVADTEIEFREDMRVTGNSDDNFFRETTLPIARINLTDDQGLFKQTVVGFAEDAMLGNLNSKYDALAFNASSDFGIFSLKAGRSLALNGVNSAWESIQLQVNIAEKGTYKISLESLNEPIYLKDNLTGKTVDLSEQSYSFSSEAGLVTNRFELVSSPTILGIGEGNVLVYAHNSILYIKSGDQISRRFQLFNMKGQLVLTHEVQVDAQIDLSRLVNGVYLVFDGHKTHKILLK